MSRMIVSGAVLEVSQYGALAKWSKEGKSYVIFGEKESIATSFLFFAIFKSQIR